MLGVQPDSPSVKPHLPCEQVPYWHWAFEVHALLVGSAQVLVVLLHKPEAQAGATVVSVHRPSCNPSVGIGWPAASIDTQV